MVDPRNWLAEGIGTFALVFFGPLAVVLSVVVYGDGLGIESIIMISLAHGAAVGLVVYAFGHISGAHINPAVTIPLIITKRISPSEGAAYVGAQLVGGVVAAFALLAVLPEAGMAANLGAHTGPSGVLGGSAASGLVLEVIFTFFLVATIFGAVIHKKAAAGASGIAVGGMVFLLHLVGVPLTGASMNPARSFGPSLASGAWEFQWLYWVGPIVGGIIAAVLMNALYVKRAEREA